MLDTIGAFGSGIGTNLLSDSLSKKLEAFKDKKAIASFTQSLRDWEIEFEKQNDGTIITNGAFYSHVKYHNVIENIVAYVLEPSMNAVTEDEFLNCLHEKMVNRIEETTEKKLSWNDSRLIRNFLTHLLTTTRAFLFQKISLEDRGLFYLVCQNNAKLEHLERIVKEKFQMQDQNVQQIVEQLSMAIQKSETEERIKAKMASWNSRQIKNLGNRYTPDLNIPVEIMDSLHGASVDQQFQNIFYDKVDKFLIAMRHTELSEINALCDAILPTLLGCDITYHELFDIFEAIACTQKSRVLICIDALNEGAGVTFWNSVLGGLVDFLKEFPHIGLLVSVRTQYEDSLFDGQDTLRAQMQRIEHFGFTTVEHDAMHQYFSFYGITIDPVVFPISEFRNPLFLRLFCTANRNTHISLGDISLPFVYSQYISVMEQKVAKRCNYNKSYKLISKIIDEMVSKRINEHSGTVSLSLDDTLALIVDICKKWNVNTDVYSALLAEGVLTQGITYNGDEYVYITYERLEDYFLAQKIVSAYAQLSEEQFFEKYSWMLNKPDLLQFFGIVLAEDWEYELSDVFSSENAKNTYRVRNAFLYGLLWRKTTSITEHTIDYINSEILQYEYSFNQFVDVLFALSARPNHPLNAKNAFNFFYGVKMSDRDATFIPIFDELYSNHDSALYRLVEWGLVHASKQAITDDIAESCAIILSWLLISPNNELRDKATKAIIYILNSHMPALLFLMRIFEEIDDPYISERIYAVAFGCVVNEDSPQQVRALAEHVYKNIFDKDVVYPNILLRTYAKNIIDYARHIGCVEDGYFDAEKITPPYNSRFPEIPSDEEIKTYKLDYNSESFRDYHWSQLAILNSMKVEYSRSGQPGGYGDFGRYTFQSYFYAWKQLHPIDLKNIAIKRIFELGYDVEKHGKYDRNCTDRVGLRFQLGRKERIGKKYQWIALYELAAQVCDNYQMTVYDNDIGEPHQEYCKGSFEPDIRNIDPTVLVTPGFDNLHIDIAAFSYDIPNNSYEEWLADFSNTPAFEQCVKLQSGAHQYLLLTGEYDWKEAKRLGFRSYDLPRKDMWHQIRGYVVKNEYAESLICALSGVDFMGRWMPEAQSNSAMYNKEYYWSDAHTFFNNPYYCGLEWVNIDSDHLNCVFPEKVLIPVKQYYSERKGELNSLNSEIASIYWHKPCEEMYTKLQLKYLKGSNSAFVDGAGELVCFESSELIGNDTGFYIRYDKLLEFLKSSSYTLVWTSLCEKRILTPSFGKWDLPPKAIHMSSVYYLKDGKIAKASETLFEDRLYY